MMIPFKSFRPAVHPTAFVAPGASVIGRVRLAKDSSVWFGCVLRGDVNRIEIGEATNIQDGSILHVDDDQTLATLRSKIHYAGLNVCVFRHENTRIYSASARSARTMVNLIRRVSPHGRLWPAGRISRSTS